MKYERHEKHIKDKYIDKIFGRYNYLFAIEHTK